MGGNAPFSEFGSKKGQKAGFGAFWAISGDFGGILGGPGTRGPKKLPPGGGPPGGPGTRGILQKCRKGPRHRPHETLTTIYIY